MKRFKFYEIILFFLVLLILGFLLFTSHRNLKKHCEIAFCNEDSTICYNYEINELGKKVKTWQGNCSKIK